MTDPAFFGELSPEEILIFYDVPRAFTTRSTKGNLLLVSWLKELPSGDRYVVAPVSETALEALKGNQLALRSALDTGLLWVVEQDLDGHIQSVETSTLGDVDKRFPQSLPTPGVCLAPRQEPWLETTSYGPLLTAESVPTSAVRRGR